MVLLRKSKRLPCRTALNTPSASPTLGTSPGSSRVEVTLEGGEGQAPFTVVNEARRNGAVKSPGLAALEAA